MFNLLSILSSCLILSVGAIFTPEIYNNPSCDCIVKNNTLSNEMKDNINPIKGYGYEWWYYTLNTETIYNNHNYDTSIVFYFGHSPIDDCNSFHNNKIFGYLSIMSDNQLLNNNYEFNVIDNMNEKLIYNYKNNNSNFNISRINDNLNIYLDNNNFNLHLSINDFRGIYPQGNNGFSVSGPNPCNTAYAFSLMRVIVEGNYNGNNIFGIGYGEHVVGTIRNTKSPYSGWHCHYIHNLERLNDYQVCVSKRKDNNIDKYSRGIMLNENNELVKFDYTNIKSNSYNFNLNWIIEINVFGNEYKFDMCASYFNQFRDIFGILIWNGFTFDNYNKNIIGFNELVNI